MTRRRIWIGILIVVLIPILVPLITLPRAKTDILRSLQASLGRQISARSVHLKLLPLPGVELDSVRLADDPAFGLEAMVMAGSATANISLGNLLRGRLVFSHVHLQSPSINLVRNPAGHWNIAALLDRTGRAQAGSGHSASLRFPYVDWSDARVNFKFGPTKTHFYLDQVKGSLAREHADWRLHLSFVPARSDRNLSNTGVVTIDGRWHAPAGSLQQAPFDLAVHLRDSYLAGSSALLLGHDAGVHGILSAALRIAGTGRRFSLSGTVSARSLRRWDLLPTAASIRASVAAAYTPSQDRLQIEHVGDPGWKHVQLSGSIDNLFSHPVADLSLRLHDFPARHLLPVVLALKANLPADLNLEGMVNGSAHLIWALRHGLPRGQAAIQFAHLKLRDSAESLNLPQASLVWNGHQLRLTAAATLGGAGSTQARLQLSGTLDPRGFNLAVASPALDAGDTAALTYLLGVRSPWPQPVTGTAQVDLRLAAPWSQFRHVHWSGEARFAHAHFQPPGSSGVDLRPLSLQLNPGASRQARFALAALPLRGSVTWKTDSDLQFALRGSGVHSRAFWALLHPAPGDLMQRVFGAVLGGAAAAPAWLRHLQAAGSVRLDHLVWYGIRASAQMQLQASPGSWRATSLAVRLAGGQFRGKGRLHQGNFDIDGSVAAARALDLAGLLAPTPYAGTLSGTISGSLALIRPMTGGDLRHVDASGSFLLRHGRLATSSGFWRFQRCRGKYHLRHGHATVSDIACAARGLSYTGSGSADFPTGGTVSYALTLHHAGHSLLLRSRPHPQPRR